MNQAEQQAEPLGACNEEGIPSAIDENLMRSELSPAEQAQHLARRKELWEMRQAKTGSNGASLGGRFLTAPSLPKNNNGTVVVFSRRVGALLSSKGFGHLTETV